MQISRIRLSVWKFVFIAPVPRTFSVSFHFGHDGIVQLGQAVCGSPHHLRIAPFDSPFGQYISYPHVLCLPFSRRGPSLHGHCPLPRYYGLVRLLASLSLQRGLPSSLAELSEHATLLCPAEFHPPKSVRRSPVGFIMSEQWPRGTLVTRLYEGGSLALSLIRLSGETRAHRSPSARLTVLTVC